VARTPQQNRVAERKNRTLIEAARTMLADSNLPTTFWAEAVNTACYVQNRVSVIKPHNKTPYKLFLGRKPALSFMRPFGCHVTILNTLDHLGTKENIDAGQAGKKIVPDQEYILLPLQTSIPSLFKSSKDSPDAGFKPLGEEEKMDSEHLENKDSKVPNTKEPRVHQEQDANVNSANNINIVCLTVNAADIENNAVDKNIVYGCINDPNMPNLEEIVYSDDDEEFDAEADMNNLDTTVFMNVKSAFLYGIIEEEVYVCQPPGFEDPEFPNKVYKVEKALYGLHQALRAWYENLSTFILENGFRRGTINKTLFIKKDKDDILLVQVYVDDIVFGSTKKSLCTEFEQMMHKRFQMSSMGELTFFLGLQVKQKDDRIFISQDKYVADILKKFDFDIVKTSITPIETNKALLKDEEVADVDVYLYRSMIGSLMYLTASRPNIMFAVCACARFQVTPKTLHLHAVKRIFRYLKGHPKVGLWYPRDSPFDLEAFSDSDYAGASLDRKSTTGAEYVAAASFCGQVLWIQNQMLDYRFNFMNTKIYIDNESTICIVKNLKFHAKTKHIEIRYHFIRDSYEKRLIQVIKGWCEACPIMELGDRNLERALATTASSFEAEHDSDAQTSTLEDGNMGITAIIDGKVKVVSEASIRRHLKLEDSDGINTLSTTEIFEQLALMGVRLYKVKDILVESYHTSAPSTSQPPTSSPSMPTTHVTEEAALMPHDSPLLRVHSLVSDEDSLTLNELTVKKLEHKVKSIKTRRKVRLVMSNDEDDLEDPTKQGRKIAQIDEDKGITLVQMGAQTQGRSDEDLMYETGVYDYPEGFTGPSISFTTTKLVTTAGEGVSTARAIPKEVSTAKPDMDVTLDEALMDLLRSGKKKSPKPKARAKDKGKAIMTKPEKPLKKKDQIQSDEELALRLHAEEQAEFERLQKERVAQEEASRATIYDEMDNIQAMIEADEQLAARVQAEEQELYFIKEKSRLLVEMITKRKRFFAAQRATEAGEKQSEEISKRQKMEDDAERKEDAVEIIWTIIPGDDCSLPGHGVAILSDAVISYKQQRQDTHNGVRTKPPQKKP
ncbi:putative ribonuclease H-like domain-containing protein, partial [Tanacetum coccineum]